jgi:hypothetical protein
LNIANVGLMSGLTDGVKPDQTGEKYIAELFLGPLKT